MNEFKASQFLSAVSHMVGQEVFLADTFPIDHTVGIARYLRSGFVERDSSKFDTTLWGSRRIGVDVVETPLKTIAVTDNGAGITLAVAAGVVGAGIIMRTLNDGQSWDIIVPSVGATYETVNFGDRRSALVFMDGYFYLGIRTGSGSAQAGIMRSSNGLDWEVVSTGIANTQSNSVSGFAKAGSVLLAITTNNSAGTIIKSIDGGKNWSVARHVSNHRYQSITVAGPLILVSGQVLSAEQGVLASSINAGETWSDTQASVAASIFNDAVAIYDQDTAMVSVAAVGISGGVALFMRRLNHPIATFSNTSGWGNISAGAVNNQAITSIVKDPDSDNFLFCQNNSNGVLENYQLASNYSPRLGNTPYRIIQLRNSSYWTYAIAGLEADKGYCRFRNKTPAAGVFPELKSGATYQYVRIS